MSVFAYGQLMSFNWSSTRAKAESFSDPEIQREETLAVSSVLMESATSVHSSKAIGTDQSEIGWISSSFL